MRFIHVPPAGVLGATLPYVLTEINWLNALYILLHIIKCVKIPLASLRGSLLKTGPLGFGWENQFPLNFAHEYILVQK